MKILIAVIGGRKESEEVLNLAYEIGVLIAQNGAVLICGGLTGVMEAAAKGAHGAGGIVVGLLPWNEKADANKYITIPIATGIGFARNAIIARSADAVIAVGGNYGTLSEIAYGLAWHKPVVGLKTWKIPGIIHVKTPKEAVDKVFKVLIKLDKKTKEWRCAID